MPTPRGGGIALATTTLTASIFIFIFTDLPIMNVALIILTMAMAVLGAMDDFLNLAVRSRLLIQIVLSSVGVYLCIAGFSDRWEVMLGFALLAISVVWLVNLYNFMDGINGIAAIQAICTSGAMAFIFYWYEGDIEAANFLLILCGACLGFIYWNFPKAKIFMGDTGSLFLGFCFGLLAVKTGSKSLNFGVAWLIMLSVFIVDSTWTLGTRILAGQKFYLPHRTHSYQKLALRFHSHTKVTLLVLSLNCAWLFPLACLSASETLNPLLTLIIAYAPLIAVAVRLKAGREDC